MDLTSFSLKTLNSSLGKKPVSRMDRIKSEYSHRQLKYRRKMKTWIGIDVSKKTLDVSWKVGGTVKHLKVSNDKTGFLVLVKKVPSDSHFVMEATGVYYLNLAFFLSSKKKSLSVVNPLSIKRYGQMLLKRAKTDKADALLIAQYAESQQPKEWKVSNTKVLQMQQLLALISKLTIHDRTYANQLEAFRQNPFCSKVAIRSLIKMRQQLKEQVKKLEKELYEMAIEYCPKVMEILQSIPGVGNKTAISLVVATDGFKKFDDGRKLCSFLGLTPKISQSGTSLNSSKGITKIGQRSARKSLYMCSIVAMQRNPACKQMYQRMLEQGKPAKVALIAVSAKIVRQATTMVKKGVLFDQKLAVNPLT